MPAAHGVSGKDFGAAVGRLAKFVPGAIDSLLKDIPKLKDILTSHVVAGKVMSADVAGLTSAKTVQG